MLGDDCVVAEDWLEYEVQAGDNLLAIADHIGSSLVDLREGNCYDALRAVFAGETILLPIVPEAALATAVPVLPADADTIPSTICESTAVQILSPEPMQRVHGVFPLLVKGVSTDVERIPCGNPTRLVGQILGISRS